jgi:hypothetical protein
MPPPPEKKPPNDKPPKKEKVTAVRQSARHTLEIVHEGLDPEAESLEAILSEGRERLYAIAQEYSKNYKPRPFRVSQRVSHNDDGTVDVISYISDATASQLAEDTALKLKPFVMRHAARKDTARIVDKGGGPDGVKPAPPKQPPKPKVPKPPAGESAASAQSGAKSATLDTHTEPNK